MKPDSTVDEDVMRVFLSGDRLPLRRNHEAETYEARWHKVGKSWNGNCKDCPYIASARESCFARRFRAMCLHSQFVSGTNKASVRDRVFRPADAELETWLSLPVAGFVFCRFWLLPFMAKNSKQDCRDLISNPGAQVEIDTAWLQARMVRLPEDTNPYRHADRGGAIQVDLATAQPGDVDSHG